MTTDTHLARVFGWTVCIIAGLVAVAICWQVIVQHEGVDIDLKEIGFLLFGGLLGRLTGQRQPQEGDLPIPVEAQNTATNPVATTDVAPVAPPADVPADTSEVSDL